MKKYFMVLIIMFVAGLVWGNDPSVRFYDRGVGSDGERVLAFWDIHFLSPTNTNKQNIKVIYNKKEYRLIVQYDKAGCYISLKGQDVLKLAHNMKANIINKKSRFDMEVALLVLSNKIVNVKSNDINIKIIKNVPGGRSGKKFESEFKGFGFGLIPAILNGETFQGFQLKFDSFCIGNGISSFKKNAWQLKLGKLKLDYFTSKSWSFQAGLDFSIQFFPCQRFSARIATQWNFLSVRGDFFADKKKDFNGLLTSKIYWNIGSLLDFFVRADFQWDITPGDFYFPELTALFYFYPKGRRKSDPFIGIGGQRVHQKEKKESDPKGYLIIEGTLPVSDKSKTLMTVLLNADEQIAKMGWSSRF